MTSMGLTLTPLVTVTSHTTQGCRLLAKIRNTSPGQRYIPEVLTLREADDAKHSLQCFPSPPNFFWLRMLTGCNVRSESLSVKIDFSAFGMSRTRPHDRHNSDDSELSEMTYVCGEWMDNYKPCSISEVHLNSVHGTRPIIVGNSRPVCILSLQAASQHPHFFSFS